MLRRLLVAGFAAAVIAGCGGGSATPSPEPSVADVTEAPVVEATEAPSAEATEAAPAGTMMASQCAAVAVRTGPKANAKLLVRLAAGTQVNVVAKVNGDSYKAGACGTSGKRWIKIDQVDGKTVKDAYGVSFAYAAAGFFK